MGWFNWPEFDEVLNVRRVPTWQKIVFAMLIVLVIAYAAWLLLRPAPTITPAAYTPARTATAVAGVPHQAVTVARPIQVLQKAKAAKRLDLPREISADPRQEILTAADVPPMKYGGIAVTTLNTETGDPQTLLREKPRPLLSFEAGNELGARYLWSTSGKQEAAAYYRRDLIRVGSVYVSGYGEVNSRPEAKGGIDASWRW